MKNLKIFVTAGLMMATFTVTAIAGELEATTEISKGPVETYIDCVESCVERTDPGTIRRIACATDCYLVLVSDTIQLFR
jgi:hypothetical protein